MQEHHYYYSATGSYIASSILGIRITIYASKRFVVGTLGGFYGGA